MKLALYVIPTVLAPILAAATGDLDALERLARLSGPAMLVLFIWLLATGKLVWKRELDRERVETEAWREAAIGRATTVEGGLSVAEAAIRRSKGVG